MKGFTLIETLLYIALFGILVGGAAVSAYQILEGGAHIQHALTVQEEGVFLTRKINWEVSQASSASEVGGALVLEPGNVVFTETGGRMMVSRGGQDALPLTQTPLAVSDTVFAVLPAAGGKPAQVSAAFSIAGVPFIFVRYLRN